jgi:hypothetical protein
VSTAFSHGADAAADAGAGFNQRIPLHRGGDLLVEDAFVERLQQLLVLAWNLEVNNRIGLGHG